MEQIQTLPIFLGFSSQKGGVGKSTLAEIVSSILYYERNIHLFVVDCDLSQDSFYKLREREKACIEGDPLLSKQMKTVGTAMTTRLMRKTKPKCRIRCKAYRAHSLWTISKKQHSSRRKTIKNCLLPFARRKKRN